MGNSRTTAELNAGINSGVPLLVVNVVAPYLLTALIQRPRRFT